MNDGNTEIKKFNVIIRWSARIISVLLFGLAMLFLFGEGMPNIFKLKPTEMYMFFALFVLLAGLLAGWKCELTGGLLSTGGVLAFYIINFIGSGRFPSDWVFPLFFIPGILYLVSWGLRKRKKVVNQETQ
jgi:hypothetical protein